MTTCIQHNTENPKQGNQERGKKVYKIVKKEVELSLFIDWWSGMISYVESSPKLLKIIHKFSKASKHNIQTHDLHREFQTHTGQHRDTLGVGGINEYMILA